MELFEIWNSEEIIKFEIWKVQNLELYKISKFWLLFKKYDLFFSKVKNFKILIRILSLFSIVLNILYEYSLQNIWYTIQSFFFEYTKMRTIAFLDEYTKVYIESVY